MADIKKMTSMFILGLVAIVIMVTLLGSTIGVVDNEASKVTPEGACTHSYGCFWNESRTLGDSNGDYQCSANNVSNDNVTCASGQPRVYAGNGLFATGGLITMLVIFGALITIVGLAFVKFKKK